MQQIRLNQHVLTISVLATLLILAFLEACTLPGTEQPQPASTPAPPTPTPTPEPPTPTPLPRGGDLTVRLSQDIPLLQPWRPRSRDEEQLLSLLYSGLMRLDDKLRPQPDLAERWEASPDGRILTFTLRSGLTWHDGQPINAVDVHFTLDRMRALPLTTTALLNDLHYIGAIATPNDQTVVISLTERYAPLLAELCMPILPRHILQDSDIRTTNFWDVPIGSGPFKFEQRDPGNSVVLSRFDAYHHGTPLLDRVVFVGASDEEVALDALQDTRLLLAELNWKTVQGLTQTLETLQIGSYPENGFYYLAFNLRKGRPFDNPMVRQALSRAIDVEDVVESVTKGQGIPIASSAVPGSWADITPFKNQADLDGARALLNEAGWELPSDGTIRQRDGKPFTARLFVRGDDPRRLTAARRIAEAAATLGLDVTVEPADFTSVILTKYVPPYDFDLLLGSWANGAGDPNFTDYAYYDPDDFALFHSSQINQGPIDTRATRNVVAFSDQTYDEQSQAARQLYEISERTAALQQAQARVYNLLPYLYLWVDRLPVALNSGVTTLDGPVDLSTPMYFWNIERWYLDERIR